MKKQKPNILFILIDALRPSHLGCYGYSRKTSPHIDWIANKGFVFENFYSVTNGTDPSLTSIFSGRYPISHGILCHGPNVSKNQYADFKKSQTVLLPQILQANGYQTMAIDWLGRWHRLGYSYYKEPGAIKSPVARKNIFRHLVRQGRKEVKRFLPPRTRRLGETFTTEALNQINLNKKKSWFLFLHYWDTHTPYRPPRQFYQNFLKNEKKAHQVSLKKILNNIENKKLRRYLKHASWGAKTLGEIISRYDGTIAYVDFQIGRILENLEKTDQLKNTLIIITADHGEGMGEHGIYFGHHCLYEEIVRVPLILYYPQLSNYSQKIKQNLQQIDLFPTILDFLGIKFIKEVDGESFAKIFKSQKIEERPLYLFDAVSENGWRGIINGHLKYLMIKSEKDRICKRCGYSHGEPEMLFDLDQDPQEKNNLVKTHPKEAQRLREALEDFENLKEKRVEASIVNQIAI